MILFNHLFRHNINLIRLNTTYAVQNILQCVSHSPDKFVSNNILPPKKDKSHRKILSLKCYERPNWILSLKLRPCNQSLTWFGQIVTWFPKIGMMHIILCQILHILKKFYGSNLMAGSIQFTALLNDMAWDPRIRSKVTEPMLSDLRRLGHQIGSYIDIL